MIILPSNRRTKTKPKSSSCSCGNCCIVFLLFVISAAVFLMEFDLEAHYGQSQSIQSAKPGSASIQVLQVETPSTVPPPILSSTASKYAYVTLISGIDKSLKYRGFLYNALIIKRALKQLGSKADFITLIGYSDSSDTDRYKDDISLLQQHGIIIYTLPRLLDSSIKLSFAEMALLKITPWSFTQYQKIQYIDGDVMPTENMDCYFELDLNTFTIGAVSPLNSGWYLAVPNLADYEYLKQKAIWRLGRDWDEDNGWAEKMPVGFFYRGGTKPCEKWQFNGADMDQGLLFHRFVLNKGGAALIDTEIGQVTRFVKGFKEDSSVVSVSASDALVCCDGIVPTRKFAHFTGQKKPWMTDLTHLDSTKYGNRDLIKWAEHLDALQMEINSTNIYSRKLGSPLGFFNANFPKGGYKLRGNNKSDRKNKRKRKGD